MSFRFVDDPAWFERKRRERLAAAVEEAVRVVREMVDTGELVRLRAIARAAGAYLAAPDVQDVAKLREAVAELHRYLSERP